VARRRWRRGGSRRQGPLQGPPPVMIAYLQAGGAGGSQGLEQAKGHFSPPRPRPMASQRSTTPARKRAGPSTVADPETSVRARLPRTGPGRGDRKSMTSFMALGRRHLNAAGPREAAQGRAGSSSRYFRRLSGRGGPPAWPWGYPAVTGKRHWGRRGPARHRTATFAIAWRNGRRWRRKISSPVIPFVPEKNSHCVSRPPDPGDTTRPQKRPTPGFDAIFWRPANRRIAGAEGQRPRTLPTPAAPDVALRSSRSSAGPRPLPGAGRLPREAPARLAHPPDGAGPRVAGGRAVIRGHHKLLAEDRRRGGMGTV